MTDEILKRQAKARHFLKNNGFNGLVLATHQNIQYFTGVAEPSIHACGVVIITENPEVVLAVLWADKDAAIMQAKKCRVEAYAPNSMGKIVQNILKELDGAKDSVAMDIRATTVLGGAFSRDLPGVKVINATFAIEEQIRSVKSETEIANLRKASQIADKGMEFAAEVLKPGITELELANLAEQRMIRLGSEAIKHTAMVASGPRTGLLHGFATQKKILAGEMVTIDIGAVINGYSSDLARTFFIGKPPEELIKAFETLKGAKDAVLEKLRPDSAIHEIQTIPRKFSNASGFPIVGHMGHNIGLAVEERPFLKGAVIPDPEARIKKNNVLAFFQGSVKQKKVANLGVRLEDTVLVTERGGESLTHFTRGLLSV